MKKYLKIVMWSVGLICYIPLTVLGCMIFYKLGSANPWIGFMFATLFVSCVPVPIGAWTINHIKKEVFD